MALDPILSSINDKLPWLTIVLGVVLVILGIRLLMGREITVSLPKISKGPEGRELGSVFVFGISYALVSLSCTLSLFIAAISTVIDQQNFFVGLGAFIAYALGMGLVLIVLTLAIALARQGIVKKMRGVLPYINRISGVLLVLAGLYVAYYGWYELRVLNGNTSGGGHGRGSGQSSRARATLAALAPRATAATTSMAAVRSRTVRPCTWSSSSCAVARRTSSSREATTSLGG